MSFTGLTSSEHSSGGSQQRGAITHTGNAYLRHVLVQAAHNARHAPYRGWPLKQRQAGLPLDLVELAWRAQVRLHHRYRHLLGRLGRPKAVTAVARELAGFTQRNKTWIVAVKVVDRVPNERPYAPFPQRSPPRPLCRRSLWWFGASS